MGIAITSGVLASLHSQGPLQGLISGQPKWESHTPGTSTPTVADGDDPTLPSRFIACVQREESARRLREKFRAVPGGDAVQVTVGENVSAVQQSDVVLLWYARFNHHFGVSAMANTIPSPSPQKKNQLQTTGCTSHP
jgi:pyrroline-5-carboxylate reductase